jgi:hypothetical protein
MTHGCSRRPLCRLQTLSESASRSGRCAPTEQEFGLEPPAA